MIERLLPAFTKGFSTLLIVVWVLLAAPFSHADDSATKTPQSSSPVEITTSMLMTEISGVNMATGTFSASFYVSMRCDEPCNRTDWDILNAQAHTKQVISDQPGETWWLVTGTFTFEPDLKLFPFDTQALTIDIEDRLFSSESLVFVPDVAASEVAPDVKIPGWDRETFEFTTETTMYQSLGVDYSRASFTVPISRSTIASLTKYYLPLLIFVIVSIATLALSRFEVQISTAAAGLVGMTVFYLATGAGLGAVGYLTLWDLSILVGYMVLGLVLACGVIGARQSDRGSFEGPVGIVRSRKLRRRFLVIIVTIVAISSIALIATDALT